MRSFSWVLLQFKKSPILSDQEGDQHILNLNVGLLHFDAAQKLHGQDCRNSVRILASLEQHRDDKLLLRFLLRFQNPPSCWFSVQQKIQELNQNQTRKPGDLWICLSFNLFYLALKVISILNSAGIGSNPPPLVGIFLASQDITL